jgi:CheY-like chemotaxis protein
MVKDMPILVVDDDHDHTVFVEDVLRAAEVPMTLHAVPDGEEAIAYLAGEGAYADRDQYPFPRLVLLDLQMPGMGGFGVLRWLAARPDLREKLHLIVLSAVQSDKQIEVVYELGAHFFWSKTDSCQIQDRVRCVAEDWLARN